MATPEQLNAATAQARATLHDASALEIARLRRDNTRLRDLIRCVVGMAYPMQSGWMIRDDDMSELQREARVWNE